MYCNNCGAELINKSKFCPNCGSPIQMNPVPGPGADAPRSYAPQQNIPEQFVPQQNRPQQYAPQQDPHEQYVPQQNMPQQNAPRQYATQQHSPRQNMPEPYVSQPVPGGRKPGSGFSTVLIVLIAVVGLALVAAVGILIFALTGQNDQAAAGGQVSVTTAAAQDATAVSDGVSVEAADEEEELSTASAFSDASASSVLSDQEGHSYSASNVLENDGACWCEGASDYGEGEWIKLELPERQLVNGLRIVNGYAGTKTQYDSNSKPEEINIEFSDGTSVNVELTVFSTSKRKSIQNIVFSAPVATEYVKITIVSVSGSQYKDTCLTYVEPF